MPHSVGLRPRTGLAVTSCTRRDRAPLAICGFGARERRRVRRLRLPLGRESRSHAFTVLLRAQHGRQLGEKGTALLLDDSVVEVTSTTAAEIGAPNLRGQALLRKQMDCEAHYLGERPGWRGVRPEPINAKVEVPFPTLPWFARPTGDAELLGQKLAAVMYVSVAINDVVYVLAAPLARPDDLNAAGLAIDEGLKTLRQTLEATDMVVVSAQLKDSSAPWSGCQSAH